MAGFRDIYDRYYQDVHRFALFLTGDATRADDLTSETFVRAWRARDREVELEDTIADATPGADVHAQHASTLRSVRSKLRGIARGDRRALLLYVLKEMSYAEVATALGISIGAVKSRINRAREALAASMQRLENDEGR
jgi:RNA polymerase sigma-70 factor (ECF subfamily)